MRSTGFRLFRIAAFLAFVALPLPALAQTDFDQITVSHPSATTTLFRIDRPNPTQQQTHYPTIRLHRGDQIVVTAGGCVQTGGMGKTWKSYTNPQGSSADHLYSGTIYIPGVIPLGADGGYTRIGGQTGKLLQVPDNLPPTIKDSELILSLGYQDDGYGDNGYYSHDDGNNDQCKNIGAAFVVLTVRMNTGPGAEWTARSKPFDLSWRAANIDANGLPVNPFWGGQFDPKTPIGSNPAPAGFSPDFVSSCGPAFSWNWLHHGMDENLTALNASCTSQDPTTDFDHSASVEPCCYCHPQPLSGHLDWTYATFTGDVFFEAYSGNWPEDGDLNFQLMTTDGAGLTDQNAGTVGMEMETSETVDNFTTDFWQTMRTEAEPQGATNDTWGANNPAGETLIHKQIDGKFAVVTGLVGIDGVHDGYTEVHPIMAMAICMSGCTEEKTDAIGTPIVAGADQTWVFFVQNFGRGGECSSSEHFWPGLAVGDAKQAWYFLSLPWPEGATAVKATGETVAATSTLRTAAPRHWQNWAFMGFELPDPTGGASAAVDGQFTLHYTMGKPPPARMAIHAPVSVRGHAPEGAGWETVTAKITDPAVRAQLDALVRSTAPLRAVARPHTVRLTLGADPGADAAVAMVTHDRALHLTRDRPYIDADQQQRKAAFFQKVVTLAPLQKTSALTPQPRQ